MSTSITTRFLNQDKRESEALTVTLPAIIEEGGGRANAAIVYAQGGEEYVAAVAPKQSITGKAYIVVEEAFIAGTTADITIGGQALFSAADVAATGIVVSTAEDLLLETGGDVSITLSGSGDLTVGKLRVIVNYTPYMVKNGRFANTPLV